MIEETNTPTVVAVETETEQAAAVAPKKKLNKKNTVAPVVPEVAAPVTQAAVEPSPVVASVKTRRQPRKQTLTAGADPVETVAATSEPSVFVAPETAPKELEQVVVKVAKAKKIKVVRDGFTMPEHEYAKLAELKKQCLKAGVEVKKSELLRAGLLLLAQMPESELLKAVAQLDKLKMGRPAKKA